MSVIVTVLNELRPIQALLENLLQQDPPPDEIVVVDGGSTDGTVEVLHGAAADWAARAERTELRVISAPGSLISQGRNRAIREARHDVLAVTDAGVQLAPDWLRLITAPLLSSPPRADVVGGFFLSDPRSLFERALGAATLPGLDEVRPHRFLPSSRSLGLRRNVWQQVGGYPEWLDYGEDVVFDLDLRRSLGARVAFEPRAVAHFRPRSSLAAFFRQYYRYARGDGKAHLWPERHAVRYGAYALGLAAAASLLSGASRSSGLGRVAGLITLIGGACYLRRPATRLLDQAGDAKPLELAAMLALLPLLRATGDVAKMSGYPMGLLWRWRRRWAP